MNEFDEAARALAAAATFRLSSYAPLAAEHAARSALDLAQAREVRAMAADTLSLSLAAQGRWSEALQLDTVTIAEHGETPERRLRMATSALEAGRPEDADPIIARAIGAGDASALLVLTAGRAALVHGDATHALECANEVLSAAPDANDLDARLNALELQGRALDFLGDRDGAEAAWTRQAEEAATAGRTQAQLRAVVLLGKLELFSGRPPQQLYTAVELAREAGALVELSWAEENLAIGLALSGDVVGSQAVLSDAIPRCRALRLDQLAYLLVPLAATASYTTESVDDILDEAEALAPTQDLRLHSVSLRADIALRRGRYADAVQHFETSLAIMRAMPGIVPSDAPCWIVWAYAAVGRRDDAVRAVEEARLWPDLARWYGRPIVLAAAEALLAGDEDGIDDALADEKRMPMDVALMHILAAEIIDGPAKARWLRGALETFEAAGATLEADRVRQLLRAAGGALPRRRRPQQPVPDELATAGVTARETDVLRLLGDGLSNADIAQRLYLSVRTVEFHVSSLLSKLGVRNRGQLTAMSASIAFDS
jgi:DNA-binding CsgD family transcriptional regulator/tetratricopeptide (TPR) repeat protein